MKNWKITLFVSLFANAIIWGMIAYKASLKTPAYHEICLNLMERAAVMAEGSAKSNYQGVQPILEKRLGLRAEFNRSIEAIQTSAEEMNDDIARLAHNLNAAAKGDANNRRAPHRILIQKDSAAYMLGMIAQTKRGMERDFEEALTNVESYKKRRKTNGEPLARYIKLVFALNAEDELEALRHATLGECQLILKKWQCQLTSEAAMRVRELIALVPEPPIEFDKRMLILNPRKGVVKTGGLFEAEVAIARFSTRFAETSSISVNGKRILMNDDGTADFTAYPKRTGEHSLKLTATVKNPLSGEVMNGSSYYTYEVFE